MIVVIDVGEFFEVVCVMICIVEEFVNWDFEYVIDVDVFDKFVDSVIWDDFLLSKDEFIKVVFKILNEGFGFLFIVERLFDVVILFCIFDLLWVWCIYVRFLWWKEDWEGVMEDYFWVWRFGFV